MYGMSNISYVRVTVTTFAAGTKTWIRDADENGNELLYLCPSTFKYSATVCMMKAELLQFRALSVSQSVSQ
jgi:hypothetical protein